MAQQKQPKNQKKRIIQGGSTPDPHTGRMPDVVLQMPQLFLFDMAAYMSAVAAAANIDHSSRARLYDLYASARLDLHLSGVIEKRLRGVTHLPIEFHIRGKKDPAITAWLASPSFLRLRKDIILSQFWGYSLMQFFLDDEGDIQYELINRKHYNPVTHKLLRFQGDTDGIPISNFPHMLFVGEERELGIYSELLPAVLYKRGNISDWAKFCNVFGMPIREYTYDAGDEQARRQLIADASRQGANAVYIHPKESQLNLIESGNKSGSSELYRTFVEYWDAKMSIRVLGNTLTTDAQDTGTQALGAIHKEVEDEVKRDDQQLILNVLNYQIIDILAQLGFNVQGGEFTYATSSVINPAQHIDIVTKLHAIGLPIDQDYLYNTFGLPKPNANNNALRAFPPPEDSQLPPKDTESNLNAFKRYLNDLFH